MDCLCWYFYFTFVVPNLFFVYTIFFLYDISKFMSDAWIFGLTNLSSVDAINFWSYTMFCTVIHDVLYGIPDFMSVRTLVSVILHRSRRFDWRPNGTEEVKLYVKKKDSEPNKNDSGLDKNDSEPNEKDSGQMKSKRFRAEFWTQTYSQSTHTSIHSFSTSIHSFLVLPTLIISVNFLWTLII